MLLILEKMKIGRNTCTVNYKISYSEQRFDKTRDNRRKGTKKEKIPDSLIVFLIHWNNNLFSVLDVIILECNLLTMCASDWVIACVCLFAWFDS